MTALLTGRSPLIASLLLLAVPSLLHAQEPARPAPPFAVRTFDGKVMKLTDLRGRPVVLDFWATWCRPCRASMPHLDEVQKRYSGDGLVVIGLSVDEAGNPSVKGFARDLGVTFPLGMANEKVLDLYGPIRFLPTTFFIDRKGEVVRRVRGYIDPAILDSYVVEVLESGRTVRLGR